MDLNDHGTGIGDDNGTGRHNNEDKEAPFRNLGYLFAIVHGARYIIEMEDLDDFMYIENTPILNAMTTTSTLVAWRRKDPNADGRRIWK